jgi:SAM-dependent methyltransferase
MSSPWSNVGTDFLSEGKWAIGQGPRAPDRQLFRALLRRWLAGYNGPGQPRLLEVGCGSGIDLQVLNDEGLLGEVGYSGYDLTPKFVEHLRERFPEERLEVRDLLAMDEEGTAGFVWCRHVLEHVDDGYLGLRNLWRATGEVLLVSWFIRPTWSEAEVGCKIADGFLHWRYSARRMIEFKRELGAHLYRFDIDHHSNQASVWLLSREKRPDLVEEAHRFLVSDEFLRSAIPVPLPSKDREAALVEVVTEAGAALAGALRGIEGKEETAVSPWTEMTSALGRCKAAHYGSRPLDRYDRFVFWGFRSSLDSMRHIFRHFIHALERWGRETLWIEDDPANLELLRRGDLIFAVDVEGKALRAVQRVDYVLHNFDGEHPVWEGLHDWRFLRLQTYTHDAEEYGVAWGSVRRYDREQRTLFQPWGTDLLVEEFMEPVFNGSSHEAAFVGAVWDDGGLGNVYAIRELEEALTARDMKLRYLTQVTDEENVEAVRSARIAPALAGIWQAERNYLPCRTFKNVSYGALAITNVPKFREIFAGCRLKAETIPDLVEEALSLSKKDYLELVAAQQQIVALYTYRESLEAIGRALEEGK